MGYRAEEVNKYLDLARRVKALEDASESNQIKALADKKNVTIHQATQILNQRRELRDNAMNFLEIMVKGKNMDYVTLIKMIRNEDDLRIATLIKDLSEEQGITLHQAAKIIKYDN